MTATPPPSPNPFGADASKEDYVGLAFLALPFAVTLGTGLNAMVAWLVRTLEIGAPVSAVPNMNSAPAAVLLAGTAVALFGAALAAWFVLAPIKNAFRQGMLAVVSAFATLLVSLVTMPVDRTLGRWGLVGLAILCVLGCLWLRARIVRWKPE